VTYESPAAILVVDDNPAKRLATKAVLAPLGYEIVEADSGLAALRCVMVQDFAVILLDVRMPVMDGFETAALIRKRQQSEMTPIIFITAHGSDDIEQADRYADGAVDFMFAPVPPSELRAKVAVFANHFIRAELLAEQAREVQAYADQLRLLTDAAPIGIFQTDIDNRYVYTNPRWTEITGITAEAAAGHRWGSVIDPNRHPSPSDWLSDRSDDRVELHRRVEIVHPDSTSQMVLTTAKPIPDNVGGIAGWVGTVADVTAEAGAEAAMIAAHDAALSASEMQKAFVASASHELRTPTTSILGYVETVLESDDLTQQDRDFLEVVHRNAQRLTRLIDDLLFVGQAEIGPSMMHFEPTDVLPLVERVTSAFAADAQRAGITLVTCCESEPPRALVDPLRLEQVLTNLVSNALKFTHQGEISVNIHRGDDSVEISVADSGIGIDPADIDNIFGRFYRTQRAHDTGVNGSGLGLAIAKGMVEAQNGQIEVTSELGHGSTFTLTLPVAHFEKAMA